MCQIYCVKQASTCRYHSNTRTKFVLVVEEPAPKDEDMRSVKSSVCWLFKGICDCTQHVPWS